MSFQKPLLCLVLASCLGAALGRSLKQDPPLAVAPVTITGNQSSDEVTCRAEPLCLAEVCNPDAYKYELTKAGKDFPYSVSYTATAGDNTVFEFKVCAFNATCDSADPACAPLSAFQLRTTNEAIESGTPLAATPAGSNWATCEPQGPGYKWDSAALGELAAGFAPGACATMTVTANAGATLKDICQQGVTIVDNKGASVLEARAGETCLFTIDNSAGRTAFGLLGDVDEIVNVEKVVEEEEKPQPYGPARRLRNLHVVHHHAAIRMF